MYIHKPARFDVLTHIQPMVQSRQSLKGELSSLKFLHLYFPLVIEEPLQLNKKGKLILIL